MIEFFFEDCIEIDVPKSLVIKKICYVSKNEGFNTSFINIILCSDDFLLKMNKEHLDHDYFTDIITFNYNSERTLSGDLFISVDRIRENASIENSPFLMELQRVILHGVLHLCGFNDKTPSEIKQMRYKEDFYLDLDVSRET